MSKKFFGKNFYLSILFIILFSLIYIVANSRTLLLHLDSANMELKPMYQESENVKWIDEYYTVEWIDDKTVAIAEPRYSDAPWMYLLIGKKRALLFDSGTQIGNIKPIIKKLTHLPITVVPSHLHCDHTGNLDKFEYVALINKPHLRKQADENGIITTTKYQDLCFGMKFKSPTFKVSHWIEDGDWIDLGNRKVQLLYTGGHTKDTIVLIDPDKKYLFTGDFIIEEYVFNHLPGGNIGETLAAQRKLIQIIDNTWTIFPAHRKITELGAPRIPIQVMEDLLELLEDVYANKIENTHLFSQIYKFSNNKYNLITDFKWRLNWDAVKNKK